MATPDPRQHLNALLDSLGMMIGLSGLALDEDGRCSFGVDVSQALDLFLDEERASVLVATVVAPLPEAGREAILTEMLQANHAWRGTEGATLALGPEDDVLLHRELPLDAALDLAAFHEALRSFLTVNAAWQEYILRRTPTADD